MLARIVDNWLTRSGERGFQAAYSQLLIAERHRVLHAPVHHPFEHGKDMVSVTPEGDLCATQLKGIDLDLGAMEAAMLQLFALVSTAVEYPGISPPRRPDRAFLVTSGRVTPPARDRLRAFNVANAANGLPPVELVERDQLVGRFVGAHGEYLPREVEDFNAFLGVLLANGHGVVPIRDVARVIDALFAAGMAPATTRERERLLSSVALLVAYMAGPWDRVENHLGVAECWLLFAISTIRFADEHGLDPDSWESTYMIARDAARNSLQRLLEEAAASDDLLIPDLVEGTVYPARALLVCGYCSAFLLAEQSLADAAAISPLVDALLQRELPYIRTPSEAGAGLLFMISKALESLRKPNAIEPVRLWARELVLANQQKSDGALPDPYHSLEDALLRSTGSDTAIGDEDFAGSAHTLLAAIEWLARRDRREDVASIWPAATRIELCEFHPSAPNKALCVDDDEGEVQNLLLPTPGSWAAVQATARGSRVAMVPSRLKERPYCLAFLPLLMPWRLTSDIAGAIDEAFEPRPTTFVQ